MTIQVEGCRHQDNVQSRQNTYTLVASVQMSGDEQEFGNDRNEGNEGMNSRDKSLGDWQDSVALFPMTQR